MTSNPSSRRFGFTLVELLVVMTIIGLLVGMLAVGIIPAITTARESAVTVEMKQIEMAIEEFKTKYGFYPPSFAAGQDINNKFVGIRSANDLLKYVNRMSPNHAENTPSGHGGESRLAHWYDEIGQYLDQESSLVFWLSGTCKNKQYPITGGWTDQTTPLAAHGFNETEDKVLGIEREVLFTFKTGQVYGNDSDEQVYLGDRVSGTAIPAKLKGYILEYNQPHGSQDGDLTYKYRDAAVYDLSQGGSQKLNVAYWASSDATTMFPTAPNMFMNPKSFQLVTFGMDGKPGDQLNVFADTNQNPNDNSTNSDAVDNICNFAEGRLDKYINANAN